MRVVRIVVAPIVGFAESALTVAEKLVEVADLQDLEVVGEETGDADMDSELNIDVEEDNFAPLGKKSAASSTSSDKGPGQISSVGQPPALQGSLLQHPINVPFPVLLPGSSNTQLLHLIPSEHC